jgi:hypothetical protein
MAKRHGGIDLRRIPPILIRPIPEAYGYATHPLNSQGFTQTPMIEIDTNTRGFKRLYAILHEAAHLAFPGLEEHVVVTLATYQAKIAWTMGYRADDDEMNEQFNGE